MVLGSVASRYLDGQGVAQDLPKAAYWYQVAAERGLAPAQYRLATLFERGKGVPQDAATALLWYERAAEGGNIKSMHNAAVIAAGIKLSYTDKLAQFQDSMKPAGLIVAIVALLVVIGAIVYSKRQGSALELETAGEAAAATEEDAIQAKAVMAGDKDAILLQAVDMWLTDLGHEEHDLRDRLEEVRGTLTK